MSFIDATCDALSAVQMPVELVMAPGAESSSLVSLANRPLDAGEDVKDDESIVTVRVAVVRVAVVHVAVLRSLVADVDSSMSHTMPIDPVSGISIDLQPKSVQVHYKCRLSYWEAKIGRRARQPAISCWSFMSPYRRKSQKEPPARSFKARNAGPQEW